VAVVDNLVEDVNPEEDTNLVKILEDITTLVDFTILENK